MCNVAVGTGGVNAESPLPADRGVPQAAISRRSAMLADLMPACRTLRILRARPIAAGLLALILGLGSASTAAAVDAQAFGRYRTADADAIAYRAMQTAGRRHGELLPLIVFMHGSGQNGSDNESQLQGRANGALELVDTAQANGIPLVFVAPQVDRDYWPPALIAAVVNDALQRFPVDPRRIVLSGLSDGGTGVWATLKAYPRCFAAGIPMSGMTELAGLASIRDVPQWIFHGARDNDTDIETGYGGAMLGSRAVVRALRVMGGHPRYTEYADAMHVIWPQAYATDGLLVWILQRRLNHPPCDFRSTRTAE